MKIIISIARSYYYKSKKKKIPLTKCKKMLLNKNKKEIYIKEKYLNKNGDKF